MTNTTVPLRLTPHGSLPVVAVHVNGRGPFEFIVDTGASHLVVGEDLAVSLRLAKGNGDIPGLGAGGAITPARTWLSEVRVGDAVVCDAEAGIMDLTTVSETAGISVSGILGYPFLGLHVVTIDYPGRELRLQTAAMDSPAR